MMKRIRDGNLVIAQLQPGVGVLNTSGVLDIASHFQASKVIVSQQNKVLISRIIDYSK